MKKLLKLLQGIPFETKNYIGGLEVIHLTHDSRSVKVGSLFFALKGGQVDGAKYAREAFARGAAAVVTEKELDVDFPQIIVEDVRKTMSLVAKTFYDNACDELTIIGITGTNGKTTTAHIVKHLVSNLDGSCGIIGTLGASGTVYGKSFESKLSTLTTPDPIQLHQIFQELKSKGVRTIVMECSAHAIHLSKLAGITFKTGIFTNLSQDHLDFFPDYQAYADTKVNWFDKIIENAVINIDDDDGIRIFNNRQFASLQNHIYALEQSVCGTRPTDIRMGSLGTEFLYDNQEYYLPLAGRFNVYNALAAIITVRLLGFSHKKIASALRALPPVPGRFNTIDVNGATVIIDYAHTPDSLEKIIASGRELVGVGGCLVTVFGCGGDRDITKRDKMGAISAKLSDYTIITSDNPRTESPRSIMLQIEAGHKLHSDNYVLVEDRKEAIVQALKSSDKGDVIIIAGKGAEDYMEIGTERISYSDTEVVAQFQK